MQCCRKRPILSGRITSFAVEFLDSIPSLDSMASGVLYVSMKYATVSHRCACGCGNEVVTPLSPLDWSMLFDGESVSLQPSIGNWGFQCQSHYWIKRNRVRWAPRWTKAQIERARAADLGRKRAPVGEQLLDHAGATEDVRPQGWLSSFLARFFRGG